MHTSQENDHLKKIEQFIFDALAVSLVLFYSYSAVVAPAATQYHRGIYVIITYVLVFLLLFLSLL